MEILSDFLSSLLHWCLSGSQIGHEWLLISSFSTLYRITFQNIVVLSLSSVQMWWGCISPIFLTKGKLLCVQRNILGLSCLFYRDCFTSLVNAIQMFSSFPHICVDVTSLSLNSLSLCLPKDYYVREVPAVWNLLCILYTIYAPQLVHISLCGCKKY